MADRFSGGRTSAAREGGGSDPGMAGRSGMPGGALHWFAVQAKPASEAIAESSLQRMQLETLLPRVARMRKAFSRRRRKGTPANRPLFPGYLFARFSPERSLRAVSYSTGVSRVVGTTERPLPVDDAIIAGLRGQMDAEGCVALQRLALVAGDTVQIMDGPFDTLAGVFERDLSDGQRVVILLRALQQCRVVVDRDSVERAASA